MKWRAKNLQPMPEHMVKAIEAAGGKVAKPNKFGAVRTGDYDSKAEAKYGHQLTMRRDAKNGDVRQFFRQVPIRLSIGRYVVDFLVFFRDGTYKLIEVKGFETPAWKLKMKALENERPDLFALLEVVK